MGPTNGRDRDCPEAETRRVGHREDKWVYLNTRVYPHQILRFWRDGGKSKNDKTLDFQSRGPRLSILMHMTWRLSERSAMNPRGSYEFQQKSASPSSWEMREFPNVWMASVICQGRGTNDLASLTEIAVHRFMLASVPHLVLGEYVWQALLLVAKSRLCMGSLDVDQL